VKTSPPRGAKMRAGTAQPGSPRRGAGPHSARTATPRAAERAWPGPADLLRAGGTDPRAAVEATVAGLGYDLVDLERAARGLLRVTIDRRPGGSYTQPGEFVTVEDCEQVTRQLQYALEVDGVEYARLEVSSPGLDRPLRSEADFARFAGQAVNLTLKQPFAGRKHYQGLLGRAAEAAGGWQLVFKDGPAEQVLGFALDEVREARLVPVVDFKGRRRDPAAPPTDGQSPDARRGQVEPVSARQAGETE
jgi:ribosome maturation factor RimP